jgi:hypothetical protein
MTTQTTAPTTCDTHGHDWFKGIASQFCTRPGCGAAAPTPAFLAKPIRRGPYARRSR